MKKPEGRRGGLGAPAPAPAAAGLGAGQAELDAIYTQLASSDWNTRRDGVTALADLASEQGEALGARGRLLTIFDHLTPRLTDSNSKVNVTALQALQQMVPALRDGLPSVASTSYLRSRPPSPPPMPKSARSRLRSSTLSLPMSTTRRSYNPSRTACSTRRRKRARQWSTSCARSRRALLAAEAAARRQARIARAFRLFPEDNRRADLRGGTVALLRSLHVMLGPLLFEHAQRAPPVVQTRLADVIQSL